MFCSNCGKKILKEAAFCGYCGEPVEEEREEYSNVNRQKDEEVRTESINKRRVLSRVIAAIFVMTLAVLVIVFWDDLRAYDKKYQSARQQRVQLQKELDEKYLKTDETVEVAEDDRVSQPQDEGGDEAITALKTESDDDDTEPNIDNNVDFEWTKLTYRGSDTAGYEYEITIKISPWILISNENVINRAWSSISGEDIPLPGFDDWQLEKRGNGYFRGSMKTGNNENAALFGTGQHGMNDMYYCVGTFQVRNITDGWSIASENSRDVLFPLIWEADYDTYQLTTSDYYSPCIGRVFYTNSTYDFVNGIYFSPNMTSDNWGPVAFAMMMPEEFSPNQPNGGYYDYVLNICRFKKGYDYKTSVQGGAFPEFHPGIIGRDGVFVQRKIKD